MKPNTKNQLLIFLFLLLMVLFIVGGTVIAVVNIHWGIKVGVILVAIVASIYLFMLISKTNKKLIYTEKEETVKKEEHESNYAYEHIRCPKCHKPFDGNVCFYCGFQTASKENEELES
jgi:hypothetical protein